MSSSKKSDAVFLVVLKENDLFKQVLLLIKPINEKNLELALEKAHSFHCVNTRPMISKNRLEFFARLPYLTDITP